MGFQSIPFDPAIPGRPWRSCRSVPRCSRSMALKPMPSRISGGRLTFAGGSNGCCSLRRNIPRRLQLAGRVRRIEWKLTGSEFESLLAQFSLLEQVYGAKSLERMHLGAPSFVRYLGGNPYPRITVTNRPSQREADWAYGPFASRAAAERFAEEALKLFLLRRCTDDLNPDPSHPGCVYSEMKMCLAPCYKGCSMNGMARRPVRSSGSWQHGARAGW